MASTKACGTRLRTGNILNFNGLTFFNLGLAMETHGMRGADTAENSYLTFSLTPCRIMASQKLGIPSYLTYKIIFQLRIWSNEMDRTSDLVRFEF